MKPPAATTVEAYLAKLPADRRAALSKVREVVNANLPPGYEEGMQYGLISWYVPLARYPDTYNGQPLCIAALGAQKSHMALYLMTVYGDQELATWFRGAFAAAGKKLDMGKSCVRFQALEALPLDVIGQTIRRVSVEAYLARYEASRPGKPPAKRKPVKRSRARPRSAARTAR